MAEGRSAVVIVLGTSALLLAAAVFAYFARAYDEKRHGSVTPLGCLGELFFMVFGVRRIFAAASLLFLALALAFAFGWL